MAKELGSSPSQPAESLRPSLEKLYFGKDDAESDLARGGLLRQGFLRTRAYEEALNGSKSLIVGRKGSGKSAICLMLRDKLVPDSLCALVTPDEISADEIRRFHLPGIPAEQSKQLIWRYVFLIQIAKFILAQAKEIPRSSQTQFSELAAIRKFLHDNGEVEDISLIDRFWKIIERLKGSVSVEAFSVKLTMDSKVEPPSAGTKAHDNLDLVEKHLISAARQMNLVQKGKFFHLLTDQIEKVWSNDRESDAMVVGLLLAAKDIQASFDFVICTVFLRTDIYEQLQFQDRDKLRGDEFHIDWDERALSDLILTRAEASLGAPLNKPEEIWSKLFPPTIDTVSSKKFLISRTLMRPRDIIQLCNACRDMARNNRHQEIEEADIRKAIALYSTWKLNDLQNEWSVNYPFLPDAFLLLSNSSYMLERRTIERSLLQVKGDLDARYPKISHGLTLHRFLSILYSIGLLGVIRDGRTIYSFGNSEDDEIRVSDNDFVIHPCFRNALQSVSALKLAPYEAESERIRSSQIVDLIGGEASVRGPQTLRGSRSSRSVAYLTRSFERLPRAVSKSRLPEELRSELTANFSTIINELHDVDEYDVVASQTVLARVYRHLDDLLDRLHDNQWLAREKDLEYMLRETKEELSDVLYRGELREFRR